jgi:hypothetical protein
MPLAPSLVGGADTNAMAIRINRNEGQAEHGFVQW